MVQNKRWLYKSVPSGVPKIGENILTDTEDFDAEQSPPEGGLIVKVLYASLDPYLRGRMRPENIKSYSPPIPANSTIQNSVVAEVLKTNSSKAKEGDVVVCYANIAEYAVVVKQVVESPTFYVIPKDRDSKLRLSYYVGVLGMPGRTAWASLYEIGQPKKGETIWVSSAGGPVGSIVGQLSKHEGLRVIGSVGGDDKLEYITKELGFEGFDYKKEKPADALKRLAPDGIDIYYDNVGGDHLEAALDASKNFSRLIECGQISQYNLTAEDRYPIRNMMLMVSKRLKMQGFIVGDPGFADKYIQPHIEKLSGWIADGSFTVREHVTDGLDNASQGFIDMLNGGIKGKAVIKVAADAE